MLYEIINLVAAKKIKKRELKMVFHIDIGIPEKLKTVTAINNLVSNSCMETYLKHTGKMGLNCLDISEEFLLRLANESNRPEITDYNNLFTPKSGRENTLFGSHHMVQIEFNGFFIGVDVAAEQFRKDNVIAEITIATSYDQLNKILMERHGLAESWLKNEIRKNERLIKLLQENHMSSENKENVIIKPSTRCNIL